MKELSEEEAKMCRKFLMNIRKEKWKDMHRAHPASLSDREVNHRQANNISGDADVSFSTAGK